MRIRSRGREYMSANEGGVWVKVGGEGKEERRRRKRRGGAGEGGKEGGIGAGRKGQIRVQMKE